MGGALPTTDPNKIHQEVVATVRGSDSAHYNRLNKTNKQFEIGRGTKQGDPLSPKLFNAVLEKVFSKAKSRWEASGWGVRMAGGKQERLTNLRFADDVLVIAESESQLRTMLEQLVEETERIGLELHMGKTKVMTTETTGEGKQQKAMKVKGSKIEILRKEESTMYLGRLLNIVNLHDVELDHRIKQGWKKFMTQKEMLCGKAYPLRDRLRLFNATVTPTVLYGCGS